MTDNRMKHATQDRTRENVRPTSETAKGRTPMHQQNAISYFKKDEEFHYRFVNDVYGRISKFIQAGWTIVEGSIEDTYSGKGRSEGNQASSQIWRTVNKDDQAAVKQAVLMRIPKNLFYEDQAEKQRMIDELEAEQDPTGLIRKAQILGPRANIQKNELTKKY